MRTRTGPNTSVGRKSNCGGTGVEAVRQIRFFFNENPIVPLFSVSERVGMNDALVTS